MMNTILGYYTNDGLKVNSLDQCDYLQVELLGKHAKDERAIILISKQYCSLILDFSWYLGKNNYPITYQSKDKKIKFGRGMTLHRLIMPNIPNRVIDHINRNKLDNRINNLRICTAQQNSYNTSKPKNSKYKYKGVKQQNGSWTAFISKEGKKYTIDNLDSEYQAAQMYDYMAEELFGEYAGKNFS